MLCPARAKVNRDAPDTGSIYADMGTQCHEVMEKRYSDPDKVAGLVAEFKEDWQKVAIELAESQKNIALASVESVMTQCWLETRVSLDHVGRKDIFGTADLIALYENNDLLILDYKFGAGVAVRPEDNAQMNIYALGAIGMMAKTGIQVNDVHLVIVQPRIYDEPKIVTVSRKELEDWYVAKLLPAIELAEQENPKAIPGKTQCRWCYGVEVGCDALVDSYKAMLPVADLECQELAKYSGEMLGELLLRANAVEIAIKSLQDMALTRLLAGEEVPGFKLVQSSPRERWSDEEKASKSMQRMGLKEVERYKKKLISPKQAVKKLNAKGNMTARRKAAIYKWVVKPPPEPVLTVVTDHRPDYILVDPKSMLPEGTEEVEAKATEKEVEINIDDLF